MTIPQAPITNVDDYIAGFEPAVQTILSQIRATLRQAAPEATEVISYGMPALKMQRVLIYFAAFKHHIGFYPHPGRCGLGARSRDLCRAQRQFEISLHPAHALRADGSADPLACHTRRTTALPHGSACPRVTV